MNRQFQILFFFKKRNLFSFLSGNILIIIMFSVFLTLPAILSAQDNPVVSGENREQDTLSLSGNGKEKLYAMAIQRGDIFFNRKMYEKARKNYSQALKYMNKSYPRRKLNEINVILRNKKRKEQELYRQLIIEADKLFAGQMYLQALEMYKKASAINPGEPYPLKMAEETGKRLKKTDLRRLVTEPVIIKKGKKKLFRFDPLDESEKNNNIFYFKASNLSEENVKVYIGFGQDGDQNGGYTFQLKAQETKQVIIPVGNQRKWFTEDNNTLSLFCNKGDIRIEEFIIAKTYEAR